MATRDIHANIATEVAKNEVTLAMLFQGEFDSGTHYAWTGIGDLVWGGDTYVGIGHFGGISPIIESDEMAARGLTVSLSGIPSALISLILGQVSYQNQIKLYLAFLDSDKAIIADPYLLFSGLMDVPAIDESGENSVVSIRAENNLIKLDQANERRYTYEDQREVYAADEGLEFVVSLQDTEITWGRG